MSQSSSATNHMGHLFMETMKKRPDAICQIDAATGEKETNASVLSRSIRLARCFRKIGLQPGDVLSLGGRNHLDLHIPYYASLLNGLPISGVDPTFKFDELKTLFQLSRPKIAFCENESYEVYKEVINAMGLDTKVITFGVGENSMEFFLAEHDTNEPLEEFQPAEFDRNKVFVFLISTSGTSGKFKLAAMKHENMIYKMKRHNTMTPAKNSHTYNMTITLSPINWISAFYFAMGLPLMGHTKLQTSNPDDVDHVVDMINKYKPTNALVGPSVIASLVNRKADLDLTCLRILSFTGAKLNKEILTQIRALLHKDAYFLELYGMTETIGACLLPNVKSVSPFTDSCGRRSPDNEIKLVDPETEKEITEPNTPGECLVKGIMFSEYYNDPEETARSFTKDGFYKTGDLLYFDENDNFYFVDRLKRLIKFRNYHIIPAELEAVILTHPAVREVCVCGLPDPRDGQLPVACVVTRDGCPVSEHEIKDLVASKVSIHKQLSGGVVFLDKLPTTSTGKIVRPKLLDMIMSKLAKE